METSFAPTIPIHAVTTLWNGTTDANVTLPNCAYHVTLHRFQLVWHSVVLALGLPLNALSLVVLLWRRLTGSVVTVYLANLAACDLLFTLALPLRLYFYANGEWPFGDVLCQAAGSLFQINLSGSSLFLACISADRCLALAYPLRTRHLRRPRVAWRLCGAVWATIVLGSVPVSLAHDVSRCRGAGGQTETRCFEGFSGREWRKELLPLVVAQFLLGFLAPLGVVLYSSGRTLVALQGHGRPGPQGQRQRRTVQLLVVNAGIFVLCFLPYNIALGSYSMVRAGLVPSGDEARASLRWALQLTMLATCANCCLDPLVYYFSTEGFRRTLRATLGARNAMREARRGRPTEEQEMLPQSRVGARARGAGGRNELNGAVPHSAELQDSGSLHSRSTPPTTPPTK